MQCMYWMKSHAFRVWMQTDPELFVPSVLQSLKKLKHLVSILNWPWVFVTPSVHVHSEHLEHTLKIMQFVCWEKNYIWFWWCARVLCFVYPQFPKDMNLPPYCLSTSELLYLIVLSLILASQTLLPLILENLCTNSRPFLTVSSQLTPRSKRVSSWILMHLFVSLNLVSFVLMIFHYLPPVLIDCLIQCLVCTSPC